MVKMEVHKLELEEFCIRLNRLKLSHAQLALAILWFQEKKTPEKSQLTSGSLARLICANGLGHPNSTQLGEKILKTKLTLKSKFGFKLKPTARDTIKKWVAPILKESPPDIDQEHGYLPQELWQDTRGYVEKIAIQVNGCFQDRFYDAASVMLRRLIETLLIECYEKQNTQTKIKDSDGHYFMLSGIITDAVDKDGLSLGRDTKKMLRELKTIGDRAAHNRRYNACRADLEKIRLDVRLVVDELIQLAEIKRKSY